MVYFFEYRFESGKKCLTLAMMNTFIQMVPEVLWELVSMKLVLLKVGEPLGNFYGYVFDGIYQNEAEAKALGLTKKMMSVA